MADTRNTNLRFNLDKELHRKAWNYLQIMDREKFPSYSQAVIIALVDYFDRYYADDTGGQCLDEKQIVEAVAKAVERVMEERLPAFLSGYFAAAGTGQPLQKDEDPDPPSDVINEKDIAWEFLQGA